MEFSDPPDRFSVNSMDTWDPSYLAILFDQNMDDNMSKDVFNSSFSDGDLVRAVDEI